MVKKKDNSEASKKPTKAVEKVTEVEETKKPKAKKAPAKEKIETPVEPAPKRSRKKASDEAVESKTQEPTGPVGISLIFQAPDLPTPTVAPKRTKRGVATLEETDGTHRRVRSRRRPGKWLKVNFHQML
ncbi:MAG: hypothetical protein ACKOFA_01725 [Rhodoluna sp.]